MNKYLQIPLLLLAYSLPGQADDGEAAHERSKDERINNEAEIRHTVELEQSFGTDHCEARLELEYYQKGSDAHVETVLHNDMCAASSGTYTLELRYRDSEGSAQVLNVAETWERTDDQPIVSSADYFVAEDIDLIRVRSRKLRCTCTQDPETESD